MTAAVQMITNTNIPIAKYMYDIVVSNTGLRLSHTVH